MKCPHCSFDNRDDAAFCENCGEVFVAAGAAKVSAPSVVEVPPVVRVPDIAPASSKSAVRASVADLVDPVPDGPEVPDLSGFERLVDSSYVPPAAAQAGDTAEIPRINEEYVPRARSYAMGPTEKELRRRDRQQKKLAKKFTKMQEKEEARKAKELLRAEKERLRAETAAEKERLRAAEAEAREQRRIAEEEAREARRAAEAAERERLATVEREERERLEQERVAAATATAAVAVETAEMEETPEFTTPGEDAPVAESEASKAGDASGVAFGAIPGAVAGFAAVDATAKDDDLDEVLSSGDEVVSLFERSGKRPARMGSHAARPSVNRQKRNRGRGVPEEASAAPENPEEPEMPASSPDEPADVRATEETALMEAASAIVVADQAAVTTAEAEEALAPRATGELAFPSTIEEETPELESSIGFSAPEEAAPVRDGADGEAPFPGPSARPPRAKGPIIAAACIALAVVLAAVAGGTYMAELWGGKTIPEVVGLSQPEAVDALAAKGFVAQAVEVKSDDPQGTVLSSDPEQGHRAEEGSTVTLSVAVPRIVPAIVGATSEEAAQALEAEGFTAVTYTEEKSNEAAGTVLAVSPEAGTEAKSGDAITVTVAVPYTVPDVEGMSEADAKAALQAEGYEVTSEWYTTEDIEEGTAVSTDPAAGSELNSGSEVTLYVAHSRGTELVDLTREILPGANLTNDEGSFKVENIKSSTYRGDGEVLYTVEARQYEVVTMPFGLGQETVFAKKLTTIEGGIVWNDDNEVSYASPSIRY
ncbi:PASTA domain-containing protein [Adlercreutzia equolifaciens]|uniref:PASTA domain-containing protein n=1 Tax=Adlercreutzia equolifaciens TaxID=446660 RepID=UPI0024318FAC|nr:PASTA domain-containing protein [Adlercreutzia equolifaciens]